MLILILLNLLCVYFLISFLLLFLLLIVGIFWYTNGTYIGAATDDPFVDFLTRVASKINPPTVLSISWGSDEQLNSPDYTTAFNNEAMKLGLRGVTIFVSSGDNGVSGNYCSCTLNSASNTNGVYWQGSNTWTGEGYFPSYPATSPFVVSVGATMGVQNGGTEISCQVSNNIIIVFLLALDIILFF